MKVLHVNTFDDGGAARAAIRLHEGLRKFGVESDFICVKPRPGSHVATSPLSNAQVLAAIAKRHAAMRAVALQKTPSNRVIHSLGVFQSGLGAWIRSSDYDVINLHWICAEALSIREISELGKPVAWTMHDMWTFTGAEHYDDLDYPGRWKSGYSRDNRPASYSGPDIDRFVWRRKERLWAGKRFQLVAPSNWLAGCARESALMGNQPCEVIHNPIDTSEFRPVDKLEARRILGLPLDRKLILFGALDATSDLRKGYDLLVAALQHLERDFGIGEGVEVAVFGGGRTGNIPGVGLKCHFLGSFQDDISLRVVYSAADIFVAPSRQDNLPNTVVEASACGLPTAAFDIGGMSDIVREGVTGALARPFDSRGLAEKIYRILQSPPSRDAVLEEAVRKFSLDSTIPAYASLYEKMLEWR